MVIDKTINSQFNIDNKNNQKTSENIRKKNLTRLIVLWWYGQLSKSQIKVFSDLLWGKVKANGFPSDVDFYDFAFMWFPHPKYINPVLLFKKYINESLFSFNASHQRLGLEMTGGYDPFFRNIIGTYTKNFSYKWDQEGINILIEKIIIWWNNDKENLKEKNDEPHFTSISDEYKARFSNMISAFICVFQLIMDNKNLDRLEAVKLFYNYKIYDTLSREETKLWHLSALTLYDLLDEELTMGPVNYPEEL
jgi:hypothetical protein